MELISPHKGFFKAYLHNAICLGIVHVSLHKFHKFKMHRLKLYMW